MCSSYRSAIVFPSYPDVDNILPYNGVTQGLIAGSDAFGRIISYELKGTVEVVVARGSVENAFAGMGVQKITYWLNFINNCIYLQHYAEQAQILHIQYRKKTTEAENILFLHPGNASKTAIGKSYTIAETLRRFIQRSGEESIENI